MQINELPDGSFEVEFQTQHGTVGRVSLGTSDREEASARVVAMRVSELETVGRIAGLTHQVVGQIVAGKNLTLSDAISIWKAHTTNRRILAPNTIVTNENLLLSWAKHGSLLDKPLCSIGPDQVSLFINQGNEQRSTAIRKLSAIRSFFNFLFNEGLVLRNPAARGMVRISFDPFTHSQKEGRTKSTFTDDDLARILGTATGFWRAAIIIARDTGLRLSDICQIEWASFSSTPAGRSNRGADDRTPERATDISGTGSTNPTYAADRNLSTGIIRSDDRGRATSAMGCVPGIVVWTDKTNTRVSLPTTGDIERALASLPTTGIRYVFPDQCATIRNPHKRSNLSVEFRRLLDRCGLGSRNLSFHCLRHTYASRMVREGLTVDQTAANLGHRDAATTRLYIHSDRATF